MLTPFTTIQNMNLNENNSNYMDMEQRSSKKTERKRHRFWLQANEQNLYFLDKS